MIRLCSLVLAAFIASVLCAGAQTAPPIHPPSPPGAIQEDLYAFMGRDAQHERYRVITSRSPVGSTADYQWYLSVYAQNGDKSYTLVYRSPSRDDRYAIVPKLGRGLGATRYFPQETVTIAGKGQLMGEPHDQVLVLVHAAAADCGETQLWVLGEGATPASLSVPVRVDNLCGLTASVEHHTIILRGPYYNATAPAYKPTINNARATLRYIDGHWVEQPQYFKFVTPPEVQPTVTPLTRPSPMFTPIFKAIITSPAPSGAPQPPSSL